MAEITDCTHVARIGAGGDDAAFVDVLTTRTGAKLVSLRLQGGGGRKTMKFSAGPAHMLVAALSRALALVQPTQRPADAQEES